MPTHSQSHQKNRQNMQNYRTVYFDDVAMKYLKDYIASRNSSNSPNEPLFTQSRTTKPMSDEAVRGSLKRIKSNAKIDRRIYPHLFRKPPPQTLSNVAVRCMMPKNTSDVKAKVLPASITAI